MNSLRVLRINIASSFLQLLFTGVLLITVIFAALIAPSASIVNFLHNPVIDPITQVESQADLALAKPLTNLFFGTAATTVTAQTMVLHQMTYVSTRNAYPASLAVIEQYGPEIIAQAQEIGVPPGVAIGIALLENGGSATAKSTAGAVGIYQLMPATARSLGLTVNKKTDDRLNPEKSIEAGLTYLKENYDRFGDWGLATWAYHAGEGNVAKALQIYAKANDGISLPGVSNSLALKSYVTSHNLNIYTLLSDSSVQKFADKLNDDSVGYPFKVIATATLYQQAVAA